jgi:hypothetical protein
MNVIIIVTLLLLLLFVFIVVVVVFVVPRQKIRCTFRTKFRTQEFYVIIRFKIFHFLGFSTKINPATGYTGDINFPVIFLYEFET